LRDFIPKLADHTIHLRGLLNDSSEFNWQPQHQHEFEKIKEAVKNSIKCSSFDEKMPLEIETDASGYALGAFLKQNGKIIALASRSLSETEKQYATIEREFLGVYFACQKFHNFINGHQTVVKSDQRP
jgi:RNase H-like domain found in reverse transcriptase